MRISRFFLLCALLPAALMHSSCSHKLAPEGNYQHSQVVADGKLNDWKMPLRFTNADYTLQYAVTNDDKNLYICVISKDPATAQRILKAGMNIYIDPKGGKKKDISLAFPIRKAADPIRNRNRYNGYNNNTPGADSVGGGAYGNPIDGASSTQSPTQGAPIDQANSAITRRASVEALITQSDYYNTTGFVNMQNGQYGLTDTKSPIQVALGVTNDNGVAYEAIIPLRNISYNQLVSRGSTSNLSVDIVLNAPAGGGNGGRGGQYGGGGGGFRPSFGMGMGGMGMGGMGMGMSRGFGGGGRRYGGDNGNNGKEQENWYTFSLARPGSGN